ncbi:cystatin-9 isoform X1 [Panthera tigris]|uniref:Cystatin 9 like n=1 Tax=Panthera tigris altaica TaxID=74533 RepID=A0A8C9JQJ3_PANTA|nr:cystatin-9 isoform X1 [Panthera tigris]XP_046924152.1 cystatin-9-like [Lynx rufus]XP_049507186.1 cystatin-9-like isoform X1 [Panthera uncia]
MGVQVSVVIPNWRCRWALPWAMLLLLLGSEFLEEVESEDEKPTMSYLLATVEYAIHIFNLQSNDTNAYRLVRILKPRREQFKEDSTLAFSFELQLRRTRCGKFDEDIDNCPFQASSEKNNIITCFFTIASEPWLTLFELWNKTCLDGFHK